MKKYESLTETQIQEYQTKVEKPSVDYPHYPPLEIDGIIVHKHLDRNPIKGEQFVKSSYLKNENVKELLVSNYGRVIYDNELVVPFIIGTFLHCLKVYIKNIDEFYVHRIVYETFDPIEDMKNLHAHHISNNALDNRPDNLLWVTKRDHKKIHEFGYELQYIGREIYKRNKNILLEIFNKNPEKTFTGNELLDTFGSTVFSDVIKNNTYALVKENLILDITERKNTIYNNKIFTFKNEMKYRGRY
jgi:hypothetical protein